MDGSEKPYLMIFGIEDMLYIFMYPIEERFIKM
jgi:hypothetical protein